MPIKPTALQAAKNTRATVIGTPVQEPERTGVHRIGSTTAYGMIEMANDH
jgi:hypothetical protein